MRGSRRECGIIGTATRQRKLLQGVPRSLRRLRLLLCRRSTCALARRWPGAARASRCGRGRDCMRAGEKALDQSSMRGRHEQHSKPTLVHL
jgi:hypothetical protein